MKTSLIWAHLCVLLPFSFALPVHDYGAALLTPAAAVEKRAFFMEHEFGPNNHACAFRINDLHDGWRTDFGPWAGKCDQLVHSQSIIQESQHNMTHLTIDLTTGLVTVDSDHFGSFSCNTIVGHNEGCTSWHHIPLPGYELAKRTIPPPPNCDNNPSTKTHSPVDSSDYYLHKQITDIIHCDGAASCTFTKSQTHSYTIGFSLASGPEVSQWITGGFDVSETTTTGTSESCGGTGDQSVCIFSEHTYICYNVVNGVCNGCKGTCTWGSAVSRICSPKRDSLNFNCGVGSTCHSPGYEYKSTTA